MRNIILFPLYLILAALLCTCSHGLNSAAAESITLSLPQWPPQSALQAEYPQLARWHICITGAEEQKEFFTQDNSVTVSVKKNRPFCLLAQPVTLLADGKECAYFKPAGFMYPVSREKVTWEQGYLAQIMKALFCEALSEKLSPVEIEYLVSTFNWKKAQETIDKKLVAETQTFYNPWLVPQAPVIESIANQTFRATLLNAAGCTAVSISELPQLSYFSSFIPENQVIAHKNQLTVIKNTAILTGDAKKYGVLITYKTSKNISLEFIYLPIYIEDI